MDSLFYYGLFSGVVRGWLSTDRGCEKKHQKQDTTRGNTTFDKLLTFACLLFYSALAFFNILEEMPEKGARCSFRNGVTFVFSPVEI